VLGFLAALLLSLVLLPLIYYIAGVDLERLRVEWRSADGGLLVTALVIAVLTHVLMGGYKWWLVLRGIGVPITMMEAFRIRLGEGPLRLLIPLKGGELVTILFFHRAKDLPLGNATGALAFDRSLSMMASVTWLLVGIGLTPALGTAMNMAAVGAVLAGAMVFLTSASLQGWLLRLSERLLPGKVGRFVAGALSPWRSMALRRKLGLYAYCLIYVSRPMVICHLIAAAFGLILTLPRLLIYTTLSIFAGMIPGPLLGIGPREAAMQALVGADLPPGSGVPLSIGFMLTVCVYLVPYLAGVPWVPWFLRRIVRPGDGK